MSGNTLDDCIKEAKQWIEWDVNGETKAQVEKMVSEKNEKELQVSFGRRIEFGTAGLRSEMGPGISRMNDLIVIQTTQGLAQYMLTHFGEDLAKKRGIVIGYDHRQRGSLSSRSFAMYAALVCLSKGIKVYYFDQFVATPFVPFVIQTVGAVAGVMVTASHNPKNDNGYKLYWDNACQIVSPTDAQISELIMKNLKPWDSLHVALNKLHAAKGGEQNLSFAMIKKAFGDLIMDPFESIIDKYFETAKKELCHFYDANQSNNKVKFCYTAMHGVGCPFAEKMLASFGIKKSDLVLTPEQVKPDPSFPTVAFPNPEEGKGALELAMKAADAGGAKIIIANDPDADRLAVAEKVGDDWKIFTGNEIGALFAWWQIEQYKKSGKPMNKAAMVISAVSSSLVMHVSKVEGFHCDETLTGFKWIGNKCYDLAKEGYNILFSYEEAIGFCLGNVVRDKDGIVAAAVLAEMAVNLYNGSSITLTKQLENIYKKYGYFVANNHYVVSADFVKNAEVFKKMRTPYRTTAGKKQYKISHVRDLKSPGIDTREKDQRPKLPVSKSNDMITYYFENGIELTLRMSGTEPKLKFYTELRGEDPVKCAAILKEFVEDAVINDLLKL